MCLENLDRIFIFFLVGLLCAEKKNESIFFYHVNNITNYFVFCSFIKQVSCIKSLHDFKEVQKIGDIVLSLPYFTK